MGRLGFLVLIFLYVLTVLLSVDVTDAFLEENELRHHSREYDVIEDDENAWEKMLQKWRSVKMEEHFGYDLIIPTLEEIEEYVKTFEPAFKTVQKNIKDIVKTSAVLSARLKSPYSIQGKLKKYNKTLQNLTDIIGLRLTCQSVNDSLLILNLIKEHKENFDILQQKCYGMCPGAGKYRSTGYRRIHLILNIKPENKSAELQIGTPYTNYWADWDHDFIYKGPEEFTNNTAVHNYSLSMADYFLQLDTIRDDTPDCPQILKSANALDILKGSLPEKDALKMFKKLGSPPNACFWWYDMKLALPEKTCNTSKNLQYSSFSRIEEGSWDINGGHSRDFVLLDDNVEPWKDLMNKWHDTTYESSYEIIIPTLKQIEDYIKTFEPAFKSANKYIKDIVKTGAVLTGRLKSAYSVQGKLEKYNVTLQNLTDIIGLRLTCQTVNESLKIRAAIKNDTSNFDILEEKCYGMCPGAGKYRSTGYRRIHLILNIKPENKSAELQIGTPYTNYWADWSHDFIYKGPKKIVESIKAKNYSLDLAEYFWKSDDDRNMLPPCPKVLKNANAFAILRKELPPIDALKMFKKLGEPPNACYWWYDMKLALPEAECNTPRPSNSKRTCFSFIVLVLSALINFLLMA